MKYQPNDSLYLYMEEGYWQPIHGDYIEQDAMRMLGIAEANPSRCTQIRLMVERNCLIEPNRMFNENNGHINLQNGMLNIETRQLRPHDPDYLSTIQLRVKYDPNSTCPRWHQFLNEIFEADQERIDLLQEFMGYSLIPDTRYEKALLLVGGGANGKSTLLRIWEELIGTDNISSVTLGNLHNEFHRVTLNRKLLNVAAEINPKVVEKSDYFKRIVSGDRIDGAYKRKDPFHFRPFARLVFAMNEMPRVQDTSHGFYRRLLMVPFNRVFEGKEADRELAEKLLTELNGIFFWCLSGLERLLDYDWFTEPAAAKEMFSRYRRANNPVRAFVEDCCSLEPEATSSKDTLYSKYKKYCDDNGYSPLSKDNLFKELYKEYPDLRTTRPRKEEKREHHVKGIIVVRRI